MCFPLGYSNHYLGCHDWSESWHSQNTCHRDCLCSDIAIRWPLVAFFFSHSHGCGETIVTVWSVLPSCLRHFRKGRNLTPKTEWHHVKLTCSKAESKLLANVTLSPDCHDCNSDCFVNLLRRKLQYTKQTKSPTDPIPRASWIQQPLPLYLFVLPVERIPKDHIVSRCYCCCCRRFCFRRVIAIDILIVLPFSIGLQEAIDEVKDSAAKAFDLLQPPAGLSCTSVPTTYK